MCKENLSVYIAIRAIILITKNYTGVSKLRSAPLIKGYAVEQLVEALRFKPEGRGFDSRWCHWNFLLT